jgi:hypothetical protein
MADNTKRFEERLLELYVKDIITEDELKERIADRQKAERKKSVQRLVALYLDGRIDEDDLISALTE